VAGLAATTIVVLVSWWMLQRDAAGGSTGAIDANDIDAAPEGSASAAPAPPSVLELPQPESPVPGMEQHAADTRAGTRDSRALRVADDATSALTAETSSKAAKDRAPGDEDEDRDFPRDWYRCFREYGDNDGYLIVADSATAWSGSRSARIASRVVRPDPSGAGLCQHLAANDYRGRRIRLTLHLRTLDAVPGAHLLFRAEGADGQLLAFYNMEGRWASGTTGWNAYELVIDVPERSSVLLIAASLVYTGTVWVDDASIEIVDRSVPLTIPAVVTSHYNPVIDPTGLPRSLQNPGFEDTRTTPD